MRVGAFEESACLPGLMKFAGDGIYPKTFKTPGIEKSFMSLFMITPVSGTMICEPSQVLMDLVRDRASPDVSAVTMCEVPGVFKDS
jgi:hypothetical protein